jgi:hypothetical protein
MLQTADACHAYSDHAIKPDQQEGKGDTDGTPVIAMV